MVLVALHSITSIGFSGKPILHAYISETENCRDVSFASSLHSSESTQYALALVVNAQLMSLKTDHLVQPPTIEEPTVLPMRIQPADQIIIRAVINSSSPHLFINWMHNNITYVDHIKENPICPGTEDKVRLRIVVCVHSYRLYVSYNYRCAQSLRSMLPLSKLHQ